jgi:hypothetical protein
MRSLQTSHPFGRRGFSLENRFTHRSSEDHPRLIGAENGFPS